MKNRRRKLRVLGLVLGSLVVGLAGLEFGLRGLGLLLADDRQLDGGGHAGDVRPFTIVCIGDSWTEGASTGRYPDYLVDYLTENARGAPVRVINFGRAGSNSSQGLNRVARALGDDRPDLLLVLTGNNDHHNLTASNYWKFEDATLGQNAILAARARIFLHSLRVWRLGRTVVQLATGGPTPNEFFVTGPGQDPDTERAALLAIDSLTHRRQLVYNLSRIVELARREDIPVVLQTYFHFHGYRVNEIIRDVASDLNVPLVDHNRLFHTLIADDRRESLRIPDGHPNAEGYAFMARQVKQELDRREIIPR